MEESTRQLQDWVRKITRAHNLLVATANRNFKLLFIWNIVLTIVLLWKVL
jgi:hypothetical protein